MCIYCLDDYLWFVFVISYYVYIIVDIGVLNECVGYFEGWLVKCEEELYYDLLMCLE